MKHYGGGLKKRGDGVTELKHGSTKYHVIEMGNEDIRDVNANGYISSQMTPGEVSDIWVGPLFGSKYIYGVKLNDGRVKKMGLGFFFRSMIVKLILLGALALLLFVVIFGEPMAPNASSNEGSMVPVVIWWAVALYLAYRSFSAFRNYASLK